MSDQVNNIGEQSGLTDGVSDQAPQVSAAPQAPAAPAQAAAPKKGKSKSKDAEKAPATDTDADADADKDTDTDPDDAEEETAEEPKRPVMIVTVKESCRWPHVQSAGIMFARQPKTFAAGLLSDQVVAELKANSELVVVETEE
jgi:hypothetical protein